MKTLTASRYAADGEIPTPPFAVPPLVAYLIASVSAVVGLFVSQGILDPRIEKIIGGLAAILLPLGYVLANAIVHHGNAKIAAAALSRRV